MWAMIVKEFRQLKRDRRTLAMLVALPVLLLVVFGYAARFEVSNVAVDVVGPQAEQVAGLFVPRSRSSKSTRLPVSRSSWHGFATGRSRRSRDRQTPVPRAHGRDSALRRPRLKALLPV